jgi:putative membrane protein
MYTGIRPNVDVRIAARPIFQLKCLFLRPSAGDCLSMTTPGPPVTAGKPGGHLANERTFLAWIRTSISIIVFSFVVAKFGITLRELLRVSGNAAHESGRLFTIGLGFMVMGIFMALVSGYRYRTTMRRLDAGDFKPAGTIVTVLCSLPFSERSLQPI